MKKIQILAVLMALLMLLTSVSSVALAKDAPMGDKTASPTELSPGNMDTTVTLSLPSDEYKNKIDIVFAMDFSTSIANGGYNFGNDVQSLLEDIVEKNPSVDIKIGVVKFAGHAYDMLKEKGVGEGLILYDDSSKKGIIDAINEENPKPERPYGGGSNAHGGLIMAEDLLSKDEEVPNERKYVVFLTDGKNYIWNNEKNEAVTYYAQVFNSAKIQNSGVPYVAQNAGRNKEAGNGVVPGTYTSVDGIDSTNAFFGPTTTTSGEYYQRLYDSTNPELADTETEYDFPCYYTGITGTELAIGSVNPITPSNGKTVFSNSQSFYRTYYDFTPDPNSVYKDLKWLSVNPYLLDDEGKFDKTKQNPDFFLLHPCSIEKGNYLAGHYWTSVIKEKYNAGAIVAITSTGGGLSIAASFDHWLTEDGNSDYSAWITDANPLGEMFADIDKTITYLVDKGSIVTDKIEDTYFTLKESDTPFTITVAGEKQTCTKTSDNKWGFGAYDNGNYAYEISYDPSTMTITWYINVKVEIINQVKLSYDLTLREDVPAKDYYPTNKSAVLDYVTTKGDKGTFTFPIPKVTYKVSKNSVTVKKVWKDDNNAKNKRPNSITVHLLADGKEVDKATITESDKWTYTFTDLPSAEYTVKEDKVDGYTTKISGNAKSGFTVTNTLKDVPVTGDSADLILWAGLALLGILGIAFLTATKARKQGK